ncbi:MAG: 4-hydroxy-3-methylbut-2-enyl diphosphate reductase [Candidatus Izimaplasma sp.]|nr:4-hydroxy-3-methylbut-2-enyl diphosphate reductase [Candidatus Izimaplasma bacterium]
MEIQKLIPRGYCHGVVNAIKMIKQLDLSQQTQPIYLLGMLIHNKKVNDFFAEKGIRILHNPFRTRLELLDHIEEGTVIFTAHGVSDDVIQKAKAKHLDIVDTTCSDVRKSFDVIEEYLSDGYTIIYIGKKGHPESEAARSISDDVYLIEDEAELDALPAFEKVALTNQTTMSFYDVYRIHQSALDKYPNIQLIDEICDATRSRQEAVINQDKDVDLCIVVGDHLSNNTKKLAEVSEKEANIPAIVIETLADLDINRLTNVKKVSVTSGASTPTKITNEVVKFLELFDQNNPVTFHTTSHITKKNVL